MALEIAMQGGDENQRFPELPQSARLVCEPLRWLRVGLLFVSKEGMGWEGSGGVLLSLGVGFYQMFVSKRNRIEVEDGSTFKPGIVVWVSLHIDRRFTTSSEATPMLERCEQAPWNHLDAVPSTVVGESGSKVFLCGMFNMSSCFRDIQFGPSTDNITVTYFCFCSNSVIQSLALLADSAS
jgi:hypothetical protein